MAGGGSGEEENYWPGYVDALTTMTMVLTFIMMILGIVIFSMSQNVSKILIKQIAEAAKIDISGGGSLEQVRDMVVAALKVQSAPKPEDKSDTEYDTKFPLKGDSQAVPHPSEKLTGNTKLPSPAQPMQATGGNLAGNAAAELPMAGKADEHKTSAPPSPANDDPNKIEQDKRVEASNVNDLAQNSSGVAVTGDGAVITVAFQKRVIQLDEKATTEFKEISAQSSAIKAAKRIEIKGYADVSSMGVTEARRIAYYRAMLIRKQMMALGHDPEGITVRIEDSTSNDGNMVRVFAK